jgi:hypothetical protein
MATDGIIIIHGQIMDSSYLIAVDGGSAGDATVISRSTMLS